MLVNCALALGSAGVVGFSAPLPVKPSRLELPFLRVTRLIFAPSRLSCAISICLLNSGISSTSATALFTSSIDLGVNPSGLESEIPPRLIPTVGKNVHDKSSPMTSSRPVCFLTALTISGLKSLGSKNTVRYKVTATTKVTRRAKSHLMNFIETSLSITS